MDMMTVYAIGAAILLVSIVAGSTGLFGTSVCIGGLMGMIILLANALYWAHWLVVGIIVVIMAGIYFLFKNFTVG